jgi:hypothetical protein
MPSSADRLFGVSVRFNGVEDPQLYNCAEQFVITEQIGEGSHFNLVVSLCRNDDGSWPHLEEAEKGLWNRVTVTVTLGKHKDVLMDGYISHIHVATTPSDGTLKATFTVVDVSYVMGLKQRCKTWPPGKTYEDIANEIITGAPYSLTAVIEPNPPSAGGSTPRSVVQRHSDLQFLRELARRRGYEFYVMGATAYFRTPNLQSAPQKAIASNFGDKSNCDDLQIFVNGTTPVRAAGSRLDPHTGERVSPPPATPDDTGQPPMGSTDATAGRSDSGPVPLTTVVARRPPVGSASEMQAYLNGVMSRSSCLLKATGTMNGLRYGAILRTHKNVTIFGFGKTYTGDYYVRKVVHTFTPKTYRVQFEACRNRMGELAPGDASAIEDPSSAALPLAVTADPPDTDVVTVQESGSQVAPG